MVLLALPALAAGCVRSSAAPPHGSGGVAAPETAAKTATAAATAPVATAPAETDPAVAAPDTTATSPATAPDVSPTVADPRPTESQLSGYKPTYVVVGSSVPNVKFQFSAKFRLFSPEGAAGRTFPPLSNLFFGYTQTGLWDVETPGESSIDTTYMPELFFATHSPPRAHERLRAAAAGIQAGVQHESNGLPDPDSRNINYVYVEPTLYFGDPDGVSGQIGPRFRAFFNESGDNPDIDEYIGHVELHGVLRFGGGLQIDAMGRIGEDANRGALQVDVSYPLKKLIGGQVDTFLLVQYFNGFAESLLTYQEHRETIRIGIAFVR